MATQEQVKQYLAHWFLLGKQVMVRNGQTSLRPRLVLQGDRFSADFEACWQRVLDPASGECYLEGTGQTIQDLLSPAWEIEPCARCGIPVPIIQLGLPPNGCPCADLPFWPDNQTPPPRLPVDSNRRLSEICDRLDRN
jgi:hypothetical protein